MEEKEFISSISSHITNFENNTNEDLLVFYCSDQNSKKAAIDHSDFQKLDNLITQNKKHDSVNFLIQTLGGNYKATLKIYELLRKKYTTVKCIVLDLSMSCGSFLAFTSDELYLSPKSILGAFDPQIPVQNGTQIGAYLLLKYLGYNFHPNTNPNNKPQDPATEAIQVSYYNLEDYVVSCLSKTALICNNRISDVLDRFFKSNEHPKYIKHSNPIRLPEIQTYTTNVQLFSSHISNNELYKIFLICKAFEFTNSSVSKIYICNSAYDLSP